MLKVILGFCFETNPVLLDNLTSATTLLVPRFWEQIFLGDIKNSGQFYQDSSV